MGAFIRFKILGAHVREQQHVADRRGIGEEHDQSVDAYTQPRGGRHAVLQRAHVVGVVVHRLVVTCILALDLCAEPRRLILGIVELGETVGQLAAGNEKLEAIGEERIRIVGARQRADFGGIGVHERRVHEHVFGELLEELDLKFARTVTRLELDPACSAQLA